MIEGYCDFLTEDQVIEAIEFGHEAIKEICRAQEEFRKKIGKPKMTEFHVVSEELVKEVEAIGK